MSTMAKPYDDNEVEGEKHFKMKLVELGLLKGVKTPGSMAQGNRTPIKVRGKLISQSIVEERR
jgi:hypothetical protein